MNITKNIYSIDGHIRTQSLGIDGKTWVPEFSSAPLIHFNVSSWAITPEQIAEVKRLVMKSDPKIVAVELYAHEDDGYMILVKTEQNGLMSLFGHLK